MRCVRALSTPAESPEQERSKEQPFPFLSLSTPPLPTRQIEKRASTLLLSLSSLRFSLSTTRAFLLPKQNRLIAASFKVEAKSQLCRGRRGGRRRRDRRVANGDDAGTAAVIGLLREARRLALIPREALDGDERERGAPSHSQGVAGDAAGREREVLRGERKRAERVFFFRFFFVVVVVVEVEVEKTFPPFFRGTGEGLSLSRSLAAAQPSRLKPLAMKT